MGAMSELHIQMQDEMISMVNRAENGDTNILEALVFLEEERKYLEQSLAIIKSFKDCNIQEIANEIVDYPEGYNGYSIEVRNGGKTYNYKNIPDWQNCSKALKECEEKHKQAFISKQKGLLIASEDGEEIVLPEISYRKSSVVLKSKK